MRPIPGGELRVKVELRKAARIERKRTGVRVHLSERFDFKEVFAALAMDKEEMLASFAPAVPSAKNRRASLSHVHAWRNSDDWSEIGL